jgi:hypothetical protein
VNPTKVTKKKFRRERKQYLLTWDLETHPDLEDFEVLMKGVNLDKFIEITELAETLGSPAGRTRENIQLQFEILAEHLVDWNYCTEEGEELKPVYDSLKQLDFSDVMLIMEGWMQAMASVPKASNEDSGSGETSQELSLGLGSASSAPPS